MGRVERFCRRHQFTPEHTAAKSVRQPRAQPARLANSTTALKRWSQPTYEPAKAWCVASFLFDGPERGRAP